MLKYVKKPRNLSEFSLMKGVTDFSNLKQFDPFETSYGFLVIVKTPQFIDDIISNATKIQQTNPGFDSSTVEILRDTFIHILEGEFKGLDGVPDISADTSTISNGINELQLITKVNEDTSIQISMTYTERSGSPLTRFAEYYLTGIKDPRSQAKTYHGLIQNMPGYVHGPDKEVFSFLYYVTDNTCTNLEAAYLFVNGQLTNVSKSSLYNSSRGDISLPEVTLSFNVYPITGDEVNRMANEFINWSLSTNAGKQQLILNSDELHRDSNREYAAVRGTREDPTSNISSIVNKDTQDTWGSKYKAKIDTAKSSYNSNKLTNRNR